MHDFAFLCADVVFYATTCFVSAASIGVKGWLLGRKLRSRHNNGNRVGAAPHFALAKVRRPSLRKSISIAPGAIVLEEKFEEVTMKKVKYLMYMAQVRLAGVDRILAIRCSPAHGTLRRRALKTSPWEHSS